MRGLLIIAAILVLMFMGGWIAFSNSGTSASVELRTDKIKQDTADAVEKTKAFVSEAGDKVREATTPTP